MPTPLRVVAFLFTGFFKPHLSFCSSVVLRSAVERAHAQRKDIFEQVHVTVESRLHPGTCSKWIIARCWQEITGSSPKYGHRVKRTSSFRGGRSYDECGSLDAILIIVTCSILLEHSDMFWMTLTLILTLPDGLLT